MSAGRTRIERIDLPAPDRDRAGSLRDVEAESGDEEEIEDRYALDRAEARAMGVELDPTGGVEPELT